MRRVVPDGRPDSGRPFATFNRGIVLFVVLAIVVAGGILQSCYVNPATGKEQISLISESQEIQMGRESDQAIVAQLGLYPDSAWQQYVRTLGLSLAAVSERPDLPWTFRVVDDPTVNAFALPGGFIYVTRGMIYHAENEAELAGVIGHEIGHVTARHSVDQMTKQQLAQIGLAGATLIEPDIEKYGKLINTGLGLLFLKFSRDDEKQADDLGLRYMYRDGYDPRQMDDIFVMLDRISQSSGSRIPDWLSTHPNPADRVQRMQSEIDQLRGDLTGRKVNRDGYLRRLDGVVYGEDPRDGYFEGTTFYHPGLKFRFSFPDGWKTLNQRQAVIGASPQEDAVIQITMSTKGTAGEAARDFFAQDGISSPVAEPVTVNGLDGVAGNFTAQTDNGSLSGWATFIKYGGSVFQILGYTSSASWQTYKNPIMTASNTFRRLTDQAALNVEPRRIEVVKTDRAMTIVEFNQRYPSTTTIDNLAIINQVERNDQIPAGTLVKRVVGKQLGG